MMTPYEFGIQQALFTVGLTKEAAGWVWPAAAGGAALLGAGVGALSSEDKKRGALIGALGGLGAVGGARYGTGKLTRYLQGLSRPGSKHTLEQSIKIPAVRNWINKRIGAGTALGLGGLGAGIGFGSHVVPPSEPSGIGGGILGLTPEHVLQLQDLLPVVQQMYMASQGRAALPSLAEYVETPV